MILTWKQHENNDITLTTIMTLMLTSTNNTKIKVTLIIGITKIKKILILNLTNNIKIKITLIMKTIK